jgi:hypothetical protein
VQSVASRLPRRGALGHHDGVSLTSDLPGGAALLLAALLMVAGTLKLLRPKPFIHAVYRLLPRHLVHRETLARLSARLVAPAEVLIGGGLLVAFLHPAAWWSVLIDAAAATLYLGFVGVVRYAIRTGTSCGCFSSFSDGAAGPAELARSVSLAVLAILVLVASPAAGPASWGSLLWAAVFALAVFAASTVAGRRVPAGWLLLGRVNSRLANIDLPTPPLTGRGRSEAIAAARSAASVRVFEDWLGERASAIDWRRCEVRATSATPPGGRRVPCLLVSPRAKAMKVTVSLPDAGAEQAVVIAVVDGKPVSVIGGRVSAGPSAPPRTPASLAGSPPP